MQSQLLRGQAGRGLQGPAPVRPRRTHVKAVAFLQDRLRLTRRNDEAQCDAPKRLRHQILRPGIPPPTPTNAFRVPDRPSPPLREDDKDGHYVYELGENLTSRYKILSKMGEGTFGRVLECWDRKHKDYVAIKIVRNIDKYRHAAMIELEVLNTLERNDPQGAKHCVALREWFDYRGHVCMVFEKLGPSLFDFLRKNEYRPFPIDLVQDFTRQLLESVAYLHELQLIHTDLKPENILLCSLDYLRTSGSVTSGIRRASSTRVVPASSKIKVIDFGSATFEDQHHSSVVSTRHYRAPEVILNLGWSFQCDMWSVGCIIVELLTGDALFQTHENLEHLAMMEQVLGQIPNSMAMRAQSTRYFAGNRLSWPEGAANKKSLRAVQKLHSLRRHLLENGDSSVVPHIDPLMDLLTQLLRYEPSERITAQAALEHPFFSLRLPASLPTQYSTQQQQQQLTQQGSLSGLPVFGAAAAAAAAAVNNIVPSSGQLLPYTLTPLNGASGSNGGAAATAAEEKTAAVVTTNATTTSSNAAANTHYNW